MWYFVIYYLPCDMKANDNQEKISFNYLLYTGITRRFYRTIACSGGPTA